MARTPNTRLEKRRDDVQPHDIAARSTQEWLKIIDLKIDRKYQRGITKGRVTRMVMHFDPDAFGTITISKRADGTLFILDGQHRVRALLEMGWDDQRVPCLVYTGLTVEEEARIFRLMNAESVSPKALDIFRARLTEGEEVAVGINTIANSLGLYITPVSSATSIQCIAAMERVYVMGGANILLMSLRTIKAVWGKQADAHNQVYLADMVMGLGVLFSRYGRLIDTARLEKVLARQTPKALIGDARAAMNALGGTHVGTNMLPTVVVTKYNTRLNVAARLPQWDIRPNKAAWKPLNVKIAC